MGRNRSGLRLTGALYSAEPAQPEAKPKPPRAPRRPSPTPPPPPPPDLVAGAAASPEPEVAVGFLAKNRSVFPRFFVGFFLDPFF